MRLRWCLLLGLVWLAAVLPVRGRTLLFLGSASDSALCREAFAGLAPPSGVSFSYLCHGTDAWPEIERQAAAADVIILNALVAELRELAVGRLDPQRNKVYALAAARLRGRFPVQEAPELEAYRTPRTPENYRNLVRWVIRREFDAGFSLSPPQVLPAAGLTHPAAGEVFGDYDAYRQWALASGHFRPARGSVAVAVHASSVHAGELALLRQVTDELERQELNAVLVFGDEVAVIREFLLDAEGRARVDAVLAFSFKFKSGLGEPLQQAMQSLDVPVFNALRLYRQTTAEWEASPQGMNAFAVAFAFVAPEISGLIEPSLLFGSRRLEAESGAVQEDEVFPGQVRLTVARLKKWVGLRRKANADKRIALFVYNGAGGKQNIAASYLNVPRSLVQIAGRLAREGYATGGLEGADEAEWTRLLLASARNVGSWAPGELQALLAGSEAVRLPLSRYREWFARLPADFQAEVTAAWGEPEVAGIMSAGGALIIPLLRRGNLLVLPEPMRGWLDDPHKLIHSSQLPPHHQYLAVYLYLREEFGADAMIHLGRHGSSEWLPGKQLGLSERCAPLLVRGDIPDIYPYIMDGIGEAVVAKRRGSAVLLGHLTPALKAGSRNEGLSRLGEALTALQTADPALAPRKQEELVTLAGELGLVESLRLQADAPDFAERIGEYLERRAAPAPFGLHAFGANPSAAELQAMLELWPEGNETVRRHLQRAGDDELDALCRALAGRFIPPGPSGDPLRRPDALPTGRNLYAFDPALIPTPPAWQLGREAADRLLAREQRRLGHYPRRIGVVLWAGETTRTDGVNEGMILALLGMRPEYDGRGRVTGVRPIPGVELGRPRLDVLVTTSGAYRDQYANLIELLDQAQRQAARLTDAENFLRENMRASRQALQAAGVPAAEIEEQASQRIFFPPPATYGTRLNKLAGASGAWESEEELAAVYRRAMRYTRAADGRLVESPQGFAAALAQVETVLHSRSSHVYGVSDIDDMYQYLGGLALAARLASGRAPAAYIVDQRQAGQATPAPLRDFLAAELDSRFFNPDWIAALQRENYAGAQMLARMADNIWGWQAVSPETVNPGDWERMHAVYVQDSHRLGLDEFFRTRNAWAYQSLTARLLEAVRKEYWSPGPAVRQALAAGYARSVIAQGVACCDHTCNNPLLHQMVVNLISLPGVLAPDLQMRFQAAVEKAAAATLQNQVSERREQRTASGFSARQAAASPRSSASPESQDPRPEGAPRLSESRPVKGFKMEEKQANAEQTSLSSSGIRLMIVAVVALVLILFALGGRRGDGA